ncbi:oligosaccharide flippase family protein [Nocardioides sp. Kera G14]|uniref:oligosaccharide flippase family protein n=1 Tax=Nocardioides sp. Kera G14 TaxID=2884264 RepID=UPI001D10243B|nr:oligosaccharide flippase family protein [Nocardioides sp. Kera G14]UDY23114.1 oligosaccharide flippase family protein [Nocardioides sp. Kera G14]
MTGSEEERAKGRNFRILAASVVSILAKVVAVGTTLITVPLTLHYLGTERYGLWMTVTTFTAMLTFADLGLGSGLLSAVSRAHGREDVAEIRGYISSAVVMLTGIAIALLAIFFSAYASISWASFFNVKSAEASSEAGPSVAVFVICFGASLPVTVVQRVQMGLQLGFIASFWQCVSSLATLLSVLVAIYLRADLPVLVAALVGTPVFVGFINTILFFLKNSEFSPALKLFSKTQCRQLFSIGFLFLILQVSVSATFLSDNFVIARLLGSDNVASFSIPDRMFSTASILVSLAALPLWPAFGEAMVRGDHAWAKRALRRATWASLAFSGVMCSLLLLLAHPLVRLWIGKDLDVPFALLAGLALWRVVDSTASAAAMYLNGMHAIGFQVTIAIATGIVSLASKILLIPHLGLAVTPWCTVIAYIAFAGIPTLVYLRRNTERRQSNVF